MSLRTDGDRGRIVPDFVTHYHRADRRPFQNLSALDDAELAAVLAVLESPEGRAGSSRRFGPRYIGLRRATETRARELFVATGGQPERQHPHYFVLGRSAWFAGLYMDAHEVRVRLADLPAHVTSFTCVDRITALGLGRELGVPFPSAEHERLLYPIDQLADVIAVHGRPTDRRPDDYGGHQWRLIDQFVRSSCGPTTRCVSICVRDAGRGAGLQPNEIMNAAGPPKPRRREVPARGASSSVRWNGARTGGVPDRGPRVPTVDGTALRI